MNQYVFFLLYFVLCLLVAVIGKDRKWGYWGYLWASVIFSPLIGILFVAAGDRKKRKKTKQYDEQAED